MCDLNTRHADEVEPVSTPFSLAGCDFELLFWPTYDGEGDEAVDGVEEGWSSVSLKLVNKADRAPWPVVRWSVKVLHPTNPAENYFRAPKSADFFDGLEVSFSVPIGDFIRLEDLKARFVGADDTLLVEVSLQLPQGPQQGSSPATSSCSATAHAAISKAGLAGDFSDCQLVCGDGTSLPAHKFVLSSRSQFFAAMFKSGMAESKDHTVRLSHDFAASTIRALLRHAYSGWVPSLAQSDAEMAGLEQHKKPADGDGAAEESEEPTKAKKRRARKRQKVDKEEKIAPAAASLDDDEAPAAAAAAASPANSLALMRWQDAVALYRAADMYGFGELARAVVPLLRRFLAPEFLSDAIQLSNRVAANSAAEEHVQLKRVVKDYVAAHPDAVFNAIDVAASSSSSSSAPLPSSSSSNVSSNISSNQHHGGAAGTSHSSAGSKRKDRS